MLVKRIAVENVRSFLDRAELLLDGDLSILIGPNGGGKTNLLDATVVILRRHLFASRYAAAAPTPDAPDRHEFRQNDVLNSMVLERHTAGAHLQQVIEVEVEVTQRDIQNMRSMQADANRLTELASRKYVNLNLRDATAWRVDELTGGARLTYRLVNNSLELDGKPGASAFLQYLQLFEMDGRLREEYELAPLAMPLLYLPVNRSGAGFNSSVELAGYNEFEIKRQSDATSSRSGTQIVSLAVGRMAQKFRMLLERDKGTAASEFRNDPNLRQLTELLQELGYDWSLESVNPLRNQYDVRLTKQGSSFLVSGASSGERELLTYLFAIFALNVRDALIVVDEPELHLHPKWQKTLLGLFIRLSKATGNQFLLATHSPTFVSPESIQYVSRVFSQEQRSRILRLDVRSLPEAKHLLNIVNSQNNERLFFADKVVLVEGISDRMFFEVVLDAFGRSSSGRATVEVVSVGGKGLFAAYSKVLRACQIEFAIVADLDYVEQIGPAELKALFKVDAREIKDDVIDNVKSLDAEALVERIEEAFRTANWDQAKGLWEYIKSRRKQLRPDLSAADESALTQFITSARAGGTYILRCGALEAYLPPGHSSKDTDRLIRFIKRDDFWDELPLAGRSEIEMIATGLLPQAPKIVASDSQPIARRTRAGEMLKARRDAGRRRSLPSA